MAVISNQYKLVPLLFSIISSTVSCLLAASTCEYIFIYIKHIKFVNSWPHNHHHRQKKRTIGYRFTKLKERKFEFPMLVAFLACLLQLNRSVPSGCSSLLESSHADFVLAHLHTPLQPIHNPDPVPLVCISFSPLWDSISNPPTERYKSWFGTLIFPWIERRKLVIESNLAGSAPWGTKCFWFRFDAELPMNEPQVVEVHTLQEQWYWKPQFVEQWFPGTVVANLRDETKFMKMGGKE